MTKLIIFPDITENIISMWLADILNFEFATQLTFNNRRVRDFLGHIIKK